MKTQTQSTILDLIEKVQNEGILDSNDLDTIHDLSKSTCKYCANRNSSDCPMYSTEEMFDSGPDDDDYCSMFERTE